MWQLSLIVVMIMASLRFCKVEMEKVTHVETRQCARLPVLKKRVSRHRNPSSINHSSPSDIVSLLLRKV